MKRFLEFKTFLLISFLIFSTTHCGIAEGLLGSVNKPTVSFKSVDIQRISLEDVTLRMLTSVKNPYPISLPKSDLMMKISIEGNLLSNVKTDLGKISAKEEQPLPYSINMKYQDLKKIYDALPGKELLGVKLDGLVSLPIPRNYQIAGKESVDFPFVESRNIPAILPNIEIKNFKMIQPDPKKIMAGADTAQAGQAAVSYLQGLLGGKKQSLSSTATQAVSGVDVDIDTEFDIILQNKAASKVNFRDLKYDLSLKGEKFLAGVPNEIINNGKESIVKVKTTFPLRSLSKGIADAIQKKNADFQLKGLSGLQIPGLSDKIDFDYDKKGNFTW
jgi:LEA14-like dessication related protein